MSMLAEPRSKQKWSHDPRNTTWSNDKTKFGYQLMTRMGWTDGKGLGANESGDTSHVAVANKRDNLGVGVKKANDDNWIAHQDDFNALLGSLNQGKETVEDSAETESKISCLEDRVKNSKTKIMYHKFVKSKDLSRASTHDLACIFGTRSKSAPSTPQLSDDEVVESDDSSASTPPEEVKTTTSACNMNDYFAAKMASLRKVKDSAVKIEVSASATDENISQESYISNENKEQIDCVEENLENQEKLRKKKKKKKNASTEAADIVCSGKSPSNGGSAPSIASEVTEVSDSILETNIVEMKPKKKKKKKKDRQDVDAAELCPEEVPVCEENTAIVEAEVKAKKKKKRHRDQTDNESETKKKKKKKSFKEEG